MISLPVQGPQQLMSPCDHQHPRRGETSSEKHGQDPPHFWSEWLKTKLSACELEINPLSNEFVYHPPLVISTEHGSLYILHVPRNYL